MTTRRLVSGLIAVVVGLGALAPVALDSMGLRITLAPIAVEIETLPAVGEELATRRSTP
jgi:hypothetical protein